MERVTLDDLLVRGELAGYRLGFPPGMHPASMAVDMRNCAEFSCEACGHPRTDCHPYHDGDSYRVFAECPRCRHCIEL
jgi:hypothetical protein